MEFKKYLTDNNRLCVGIFGIMLAIGMYLFDSRFLLIPAVFAPILLVIFKSNKTLGVLSILISIGCLILGIYNTYTLLFIDVPKGYMYGFGGNLGMMPIKLAFGWFIIIYSLFCAYCLTIEFENGSDKFCSKCGKSLSNEDIFCPNCGKEL